MIELKAPYGALMIQEIDDLKVIVRRAVIHGNYTCDFDTATQYVAKRLIESAFYLIVENREIRTTLLERIYTDVLNQCPYVTLVDLLRVPVVFGDESVLVKIQYGFLYIWYRGKNGKQN